MTATKTRYMSALLTVATLTAVVSAGVKPAKAAIIADTTPTIASMGERLINFNGDPTIKTFFEGKNQEVTYTGGGIVSGNVNGEYAAPAADADGDPGMPNLNRDDTPYLSTGGPGQLSPVEFKFKYPIISSFGFLWGSIDSYNTIEFFRDSDRLASFTGDIFAPADGNQGPSGTSYVNFISDSVDTYFNRVILTSTSPAFEFDDVRYTEVPTPALLPGLVGIGVAAFRKRKQVGEAQEV